MRPPDPGPSAPPDDQCLVHHFIRTHGRRPSADELAAVRDGVVTASRAAETLHAATSAAVVHALRREMARLVARW